MINQLMEMPGLAGYEEAPPAPQWVVDEARARERAAERDRAQHEDRWAQREALSRELVGEMGIRHHLDEAEVSRRRESMRASLDVGVPLADALFGSHGASLRRRGTAGTSIGGSFRRRGSGGLAGRREHGVAEASASRSE